MSVVLPPLAVKDLQAAIGRAVVEIIPLECYIQGSDAIAFFQNALDTEFAVAPEEVKEPSPIPSTPSSLDINFDAESKYDVEDLPMTGREAVVYFIKCRHLRKPACAYFNYAGTEIFRPYDLISVRKEEIGSTYFLFSPFGVLHVYPDRPAERLGLLDWEKEATLWEILRKIPFFKYYYLKKSFVRWRQNVSRLKFSRSKMNVALRLSFCTPPYTLVLLHCQRLMYDFLQSIGTIFVEKPLSSKPTEISGLITRVTKSTNMIRSAGSQLFTCCRDALNLLRVEMCGHLMAVQTELLRLQHYQSGKESLHIRRVRLESTRGKLAKCWYEYYRIISLAVLMDQMIAGQFYSFVLEDMTTFLNLALARVKKPPVIRNNDAVRQEERHHNLITPGSHEGEVEDDGPGSPASSTVISVTHADVEQLKMLSPALFFCEISCDTSTQKLVESPTEDEVLTTVTNLLEFVGKTVDECAAPFHYSTQHLIEGFHQLSSFEEGVRLTYFPSDIAGGCCPNYNILVPTDPRATETSEPLFIKMMINLQQEILRICPDWVPSCEMEPLSGENLLVNVTQNCHYEESLANFSKAVKASFAEAKRFIEQHLWVAEICHFCENWSEEKVNEIIASSTREIEEAFREIAQYRERIGGIETSFTAGGDNRMLFVSSEKLATTTVATLDQIYSSFSEAFRKTTITYLARFTADMTSLTTMLENPPAVPSGATDNQLSLFSHFSAKVAECRRNKASYDAQLARFRADMTVLRTIGAAGSSDDALLEMTAVQAFEKFVKRLQDCVPVVSKQTDLTLTTVKSRLEELKDACYRIYIQGTSNEFLNASTDQATAIDKLARLLKEYDELYSQIEELWFFHDSMSEEGLNSVGPSTRGGEQNDDQNTSSETSENQSLSQRHCFIEWRKAVEIRRELWHYLQQASVLIEDWVQLPIKKLPFVLIEDKLNAWNIAGLQIEETLAHSEDAVLQRYSEVIERCRRLLVFASKLQTPHMTSKFLRRLYGRLSLSFDWRRDDYSLADWEPLWNASGDLTENNPVQQCLDIVHAEALAEAAANKKLDHLANYWNEYGIQVSTCVIGTAVLRSALRSARSSASRRSSSARIQTTSSSRYVDFNVLAEFESFRLAAEKSKAEIQSIFTNVSAFDDTIRFEKAQTLSSRLDFYGDFMSLAENLQFVCQFFLASVDVAVRHQFIDSEVAEQTRTAVSEWQSIVNRIVEKPRFLSWTSEEQKSVEASFKRLFEEINGVLNDKFTKYFDFVRVRSPRLFGLSNWEIVMLTAHIQVGGNASGLKKLGPFLSKCFPHVTGLVRVSDEESTNTAVTVPLIDGLLLCFGEKLSFKNVIPVSPIPEVLIASIEEELRRSVMLDISSAILELEKRERVFSKEFLASHSSQSLTIAQSTKFGRNFVDFVGGDNNKAAERPKSSGSGKQLDLKGQICAEVDYYAREFLVDTRGKPEDFLKAKNLMAQLIYQRDFASTCSELGEFTGLYHTCNVLTRSPVSSNEICVSDLRLQTGGLSPAVPYLCEPICAECWSSTAILTPELARALSVTLVQTSYVTQFSMVDGKLFSGRTHSIRTLANLAGRPFFSVDCSIPKTYDSIRSVLATSVTLGSLVVFREVDSLPPFLYGQLSSLLTNLRLSISNLFSSALKTKKNDGEADRPLSSRKSLRSTTPSRSRRSSANASILAAPYNGTLSPDNILRPETTASSFRERQLSTLAESGIESIIVSEHDEVIDFDGLLLSSAVNVVPQPLIFCTFSKPVTSGLRLSLRQLILPGSSLTLNMQQVLAVNLKSAGFLNAENLSRKTATVIQRIHSLFPEFEQWGLLHSWRFAGIVSAISANRRLSEIRLNEMAESDEIQMAQLEELCLLRSVHVLLSSRLNGEKQEEAYKGIIREVFTSPTARPGSAFAFGYDPFLVDAIEAALKHLHLDCQISQIAKILQLHAALNSASKQSFDPVIVTGPPGCGKSTLVNVLAAVFNGVVETSKKEIDSLDVTVQKKVTKSLPWGMRNPLGLAKQTIRVLQDVPSGPDEQGTLFTRLQKLKQILAGGLYTTLEALRASDSVADEDRAAAAAATETALAPPSAASSEDAPGSTPSGVQSVVSIFECSTEEDGTLLAREIRQRFPRILHQQQIWVKLNAMYAAPDIEPFLRAWCDDRLQIRAGGGVRLIAELSPSVVANISPGSLGSLVVINCFPPNWTALLSGWRHMATHRWLINESELEWVFMHVSDVFEAVSDFSAAHCSKSWSVPGMKPISYRMHEATVFLTILSTCFDYVIPKEKFVEQFAKFGNGCVINNDKFDFLLSGYRDRLKACLVFALVHTFLQSVNSGDVAKLSEFMLRKLQSTTYASALPDGIQSSQLNVLTFLYGGDGLTGLTPFPSSSTSAYYPMDLPMIFNPVGVESSAEDVFTRLNRCCNLQSLQPFYWLLDFLQAGKCAGNLLLIFEPGLSVRRSLINLASANPELIVKIFKIAPRISVKHMLDGIDKMVNMKSAYQRRRFAYAVDDLCAVCESDEPQVVRSLTTVAATAYRLPGIQDSPRSFAKLMLLWNSAMSRSMPFELLRHFLPITLATPPAVSILNQRYAMQTIQWGMSAITGRYAVETPKVRRLIELLLQSTAEIFDLIRQRTAISSQKPSPFSFTPANLSMFFNRLLAYPARSLSSKQVHSTDCVEPLHCVCIRRSIVHLWRNELVVCLGQRFVTQTGDWFTEVVNQSILARLSLWPDLISKKKNQEDDGQESIVATSEFNQEDDHVMSGLQEPPFLSFLFANIHLPELDQTHIATKNSDKMANLVISHNDLKRRLVRLLNQLATSRKLEERLFIQMSDDVTVTVERLMMIISRPQARLLLFSSTNHRLAPGWRPLVMLASAALNFEFVDLSIAIQTATEQLKNVCRIAATTRHEFVIRLSHSSDPDVFKLAIAVAMCPSTSGILGDWDQIVKLTHHVDPATDNVDWLDRRIRESIRFVFCLTPLVVSPSASTYFAEVADLFRPLQHRLYVLNCQLDSACLPQIVDSVMSAQEIPESLVASLTITPAQLVECYETALEFLAAKFPLLPSNAYERTFSRLSFATFVHMFQSVYIELYTKIRNELEYFEKLLERLRVGVILAETMTADMTGVKAQIEKAWLDFRNSKARAEELREELIAAEKLCTQTEEELYRLKLIEEQARERLTTKLSCVNPQYEAAVAALENLSKPDVEEFRSYRDPEPYIVNIVNALCVLFNRPEKWESGKLLLISSSFFEMLIYYPKNEIPDDMFDRLGQYVLAPDFSPPVAEIHSKAARSICSWLLSVYNYAKIFRQLAPLIAEHRRAADEFEAIKRLLGRRRVAANNVRASLNAEIARAKALKRTADMLEQQIRDLERDLMRTREIIGVLIRFRCDIEYNVVDLLKQRLKHVAIDSMLTAAAVQFGGLLGFRESTLFLENLARRTNYAVEPECFIYDWQRVIVDRTVPRKLGENGEIPPDRKFQSSVETFILNEEEMSCLICEQQISDTELRQVLSLDICLRHSPTNWPLLIGPALLARDIVNTWSGNMIMWHDSLPARVVEISVLDHSKFTLQNAIEAAVRFTLREAAPVVVLVTDLENALDGSDALQLEQILAYTNRLNGRCGNLKFVFQTELPFHLLVHWDSQISLDRFCIITLNPLFDIHGATRDLLACAPRPEFVTGRSVNSRELVNQIVSLRDIRSSTGELLMNANENFMSDEETMNKIRHALGEIDSFCHMMSYYGAHRESHLIGDLESPFVDTARQLTNMYDAICDAATLSPAVHLPAAQYFDVINSALADLVVGDHRIPTAQLKLLSLRVFRQVTCRISGLLRNALPDNLLRQVLTCVHCRVNLPQTWLTNRRKREKSDHFFPFTSEIAKYRIFFGFTEKLFAPEGEIDETSIFDQQQLVDAPPNNSWINPESFKLFSSIAKLFNKFLGVFESICSSDPVTTAMWQECFADFASASIFTNVDSSMLELDATDRCILWSIAAPSKAPSVVDSLVAADFGAYIFQAGDYAPSPKLSSTFLVLEAENCLQAFDAISWLASKTTQEPRETSGHVPSQSFSSSIRPFENISCVAGSSPHLVEQMIDKFGHNVKYALVLLNVDHTAIGQSRTRINQFVKYSKKQVINSEASATTRRRSKRMSVSVVTPFDIALSLLPKTVAASRRGNKQGNEMAVITGVVVDDDRKREPEPTKAAFFATVDSDVASDSQAQRRVPTWLLISARRLCIKPNTADLLASHTGPASWPSNLCSVLLRRSILLPANHRPFTSMTTTATPKNTPSDKGSKRTNNNINAETSTSPL